VGVGLVFVQTPPLPHPVHMEKTNARITVFKKRTIRYPEKSIADDKRQNAERPIGHGEF
jgi:hypothetical protein